MDHTTICRWVQRYGPEIRRRLRGNLNPNLSPGTSMKPSFGLPGVGCTCSAQSTATGRPWISIFRRRAIGKAAKRFLKKVLANRDNRPLCVFARDGLRSYPAAIRELQRDASVLAASHGALCEQLDRIGPPIRQATAESDAGTTKHPTARRLLQGIEAVHMICGQVLGITRNNVLGQAWVFGALLGIR